MSVIIHGLNMPRNCLDCKIRGYRLVCPILDRYAMNNKTDRRSDCPLVPLPEGHGKLIDADELMNRARGCLDELTLLSLEFLINGSNTIIPAEGDETDADL